MTTARRFVVVTVVLISSLLVATGASAAEDWKGETRIRSWTLGAVTGLVVVDGIYGFGIEGQFARKIVDKGFAEDISNQVWIEVGVGPAVANGTWGAIYSTHLRWEFHQNSTWTFYALGGLGGSVMGVSTRLFPRFGVGTLYHLMDNLAIRGEVSHELIAGGVSFSFEQAPSSL